MQQREAFDALASDYDTVFSQSPIARFLRHTTHRCLLSAACVGETWLELGCGTGEDAVTMAGHGVHVVATDASAQMRTITQRKCAGRPVDVLPLDLNALPDDFAAVFAGAWANFGVLNCVVDMPLLARWLAQRIMPGGAAMFGVMADRCLWEIGWHSLHSDFKTAFRRFRPAKFTTDSGEITVKYPTPTELARDFHPYFTLQQVMPLGIALPPGDIAPIIERHSTLLRLCKSLEQGLSQYDKLARYADHYWIELVRNAVNVGADVVE